MIKALVSLQMFKPYHAFAAEAIKKNDLNNVNDTL